MKNLIKKVSTKASLWFLFGLLIVFNILMNAPGLPTSAAPLQSLSNTAVFDLMASGYDVPMVQQVLTSYGEEGRSIYHNFMLLDVFFPAVYGLFFSGLLFSILGEKKNFLRFLFVFPLLTALLDYLENMGIFLMVGSFPDVSATFVAMASFFTQTKMVGNLFFVLSLLTGIVVWAIGKWNRR